MKKWILLLFAATLLVLFLCACGQNEQGTPASAAVPADAPVSLPASSGETQGGQGMPVTIQITPPEGWEPVEGSVLAVQYLKGSASFMAKEEPFAGDTLDAVVSEALSLFEKSFENVAVQGEPEAITVDGREAKKLTFTCTLSGLEMKFQYVYLFAEGKTFAITFGDLASTFDALAADYQTILDSIHFAA